MVRPAAIAHAGLLWGRCRPGSLAIGAILRQQPSGFLSGLLDPRFTDMVRTQLEDVL